MRPEWRGLLGLRSVKDKFGLAVDCDQADRDIIAELVREGVIVWIDRATLPHVVIDKQTTKVTGVGLLADVYQLTPKGVALCDANGIERH